jgi:hypothetical protein
VLTPAGPEIFCPQLGQNRASEERDEPQFVQKAIAVILQWTL